MSSSAPDENVLPPGFLVTTLTTRVGELTIGFRELTIHFGGRPVGLSLALLAFVEIR